jgi:N-methylhydantoinase B
MLQRANGSESTLSSKVSDVALQTEDLISVRTPAAGGYGAPKSRDPQAVLRDIIEGKVSVRAAAELYGVVLKENETAIDEEKTRQVRAA